MKAVIGMRTLRQTLRPSVLELMRPHSSRIQQAFDSGAASTPSSDNPHSQHFNLTPTAQALLPPIPLYRRLLRAHRHALAPEMRSLGDAYIKDEFRRHRKTDNPLHLIGFLSQWKLYLDALEVDRGLGMQSDGRRLDADLLEKLSEEQVYQLYELYSHLLGSEESGEAPP